MKQDAKSRKKGSKADAKPWLEWVASSLGLLIVLSVVALLGWDALNQDGAPPAVLIDRGRIAQHQAGYTVEITVRNAANATVAEVQIEGVLRRSGEIVETARTRIDYLPGSSVRRAGLFFTRDPREHEMTIRALGYAEP